MQLDTAVQVCTLIALVAGFVLYFVQRGGDEATVKSRMSYLEAQQSEGMRELKELRGISTDLLRTVAVGAETFNGLKSSITEAREELMDIERRLRVVESKREAVHKS